jgi:phasin protein
MLSEEQNKPAGKAGQRKRKTDQTSKKPEQRSRKADQQLEVKPDQLRAAPEQIDALEQIEVPIGSTDSSASDTLQIDSEPTAPLAPAESDAVGEPAVETTPVSMQTLANAYGEYTRKSFEQTKSFLEKLAGVRTLDKAFELQTEFAKQAYGTFVAESQKIQELHSEMARQRLKRFEGFVGHITQGTARRP